MKQTNKKAKPVPRRAYWEVSATSMHSCFYQEEHNIGSGQSSQFHYWNFSPNKFHFCGCLCDIPVNLSYLIAEFLVYLIPRVHRFLTWRIANDKECPRGAGSALGFFFFLSLINLSSCLGHYKQPVSPSGQVWAPHKALCPTFNPKLGLWGGGKGKEKTTKNGDWLFLQSLGFQNDCLENWSDPDHWGVGSDIHSPVGWLWLGSGKENLGRRESTPKEK